MIIRGLSIQDYHAADCETNTRLKCFRRSPIIYKKTYIDRTMAGPKSDAMDEGSGFDCLLFDGDAEFAHRYVTEPPTYMAVDGTTKPWSNNANVCKAWHIKQHSEGRTVLDSDAFTRFCLMHQALKSHPVVQHLLAQSESQVTFRRDTERFGLTVQVRPDAYSQKPIDLPEYGLTSGGLPFLWDLKTTETWDQLHDITDPASPLPGRYFYKYGIHRQGGMCQWVAFQDIGQTAIFHVVQERVEPFRTGIFVLSDDFLDLGWAAVEKDLLSLGACRTANVWPGSPTKVVHVVPEEFMLHKGLREATP